MAPGRVPVFLVGPRLETAAAASAAAGDLELAGTAPSLRDAVDAVGRLRPAVVVFDLDGNESAGAAIPALLAAAPEVRVLALTESSDPMRHAAALYAGARGLIRKDRAGEFLTRAVPKVLAGELWFERQFVASALVALLAAKRRLEDQGPRRVWLPPRRRDMLALAGDGLADDAIASRLSLPVGVVRSQVAALTKKLRLSSRLELVAYAHRVRASTALRTAGSPGA